MSCSFKSRAMLNLVVACKCTTRCSTSGHVIVYKSLSLSASFWLQNFRIVANGAASCANRVALHTQYAENNSKYIVTTAFRTKPPY